MQGARRAVSKIPNGHGNLYRVPPSLPCRLSAALRPRPRHRGRGNCSSRSSRQTADPGVPVIRRPDVLGSPGRLHHNLCRWDGITRCPGHVYKCMSQAKSTPGRRGYHGSQGNRQTAGQASPACLIHAGPGRNNPRPGRSTR